MFYEIIGGSFPAVNVVLNEGETVITQSGAMAWCDENIEMSTNAEGMSNALIEAVCVGLPVITTNVSGAEELVDDGKTGLITPIGDEAQLVIALRKMLRNEDLMKETVSLID